VFAVPRSIARSEENKLNRDRMFIAKRECSAPYDIGPVSTAACN
jgi:hypothetical protein